MRDMFEEAAKEARSAWLLVFVALLALGGVIAFGAAVTGCYPRPPGPTPSCVEDPSQPWCAPPPFAVPRGCAAFRVDIDQDAGVVDGLGVWHYPARATVSGCRDGGAR